LARPRRISDTDGRCGACVNEFPKQVTLHLFKNSFCHSLLVTRGHFQSCDKYGSHTIHSAKNPTLHANFMTLCFIEPELLLMEVLHCRNRVFFTFFAPVILTWTQ